jgi:phage terminase large subunit
LNKLAEDAFAMMDRAAIDPDWFFDDIVHASPDIWQRELAHAIADVVRKKKGLPTRYNHKGLNKFTVRSGHGTGKTYGVALFMHWFKFCFRGRSPVLAPKLDQVKGRIFGAFADVLAGSPPWYKAMVDSHATKIIFKNDPQWYFEAVAAAKPENAQGFHDDFMLVVVEEASGVEEKLFPVIDGMLSTGIVVILIMISNPTRTEGSFYESHCKPIIRDRYFKYHVSVDKVERPGFHEWLKELEEKYGVDSPVVKVRGYGEFANLAEHQIIALEWIQAAKDREFEDLYDGSIPRLRISVDCADGGDDRTTITVCEHYDTFVKGLKQSVHAFPMYEAGPMTGEAVGRIWDHFKGSGYTDGDVVIDYIGPGTGVFTWLQQNRPDIPLIAYKGGSGSDDYALWENRRTQSYCVARDFLENGWVCFNEDFLDDREWSDFEGQLTSIKKKPSAEKREILEAKANMVAKGIKSPDQGDGWAMQYATQLPVTGESLADFFVVPAQAVG